MMATAVITVTFYTSRLCFNPTPLIKDTISELRILVFVLIQFSQQVNQVGFFFYLADAAGLTDVGRNGKLQMSFFSVLLGVFLTLSRMLHLSKV